MVTNCLFEKGLPMESNHTLVFQYYGEHIGVILYKNAEGVDVGSLRFDFNTDDCTAVISTLNIKTRFSYSILKSLLNAFYELLIEHSLTWKITVKVSTEMYVHDLMPYLGYKEIGVSYEGNMANIEFTKVLDGTIAF